MAVRQPVMVLLVLMLALMGHGCLVQGQPSAAGTVISIDNPMATTTADSSATASATIAEPVMTTFPATDPTAAVEEASSVGLAVVDTPADATDSATAQPDGIVTPVPLPVRPGGGDVPVTPTAFGRDLVAAAKKAADTVKDVTQRVAAEVENIVSDIKTIYAASSTCLAAMDTVRLRATKRALEYHGAVMRILTDAELLPINLVLQVFNKVFPQLVKDPKPLLWRLHNPTAYVYSNAAAILTTVDATTLKANLQPTVTAFFYVHGMLYPGTKEAAANDWYSIERNAGFFSPSGVCNWAGASCQVYLLAYDTSYPAAYETIIRNGFASIMGGTVTGAPFDLFTAVMWREYERRARLAGDYLANLLTPYNPSRATRNIMITHSLGSFAVAHAAHKLYTARTTDPGRFKLWFACASALPTNAFAPATGMFYNAPKLVYNAGSVGTTRGMTKVYHSLVDVALTIPYFYANGGVFALGQVGSSCTDTACPNVANEDVTNLVGATHGPAGFFDTIMPMVATEVQTRWV